MPILISYRNIIFSVVRILRWIVEKVGGHITFIEIEGQSPRGFHLVAFHELPPLITVEVCFSVLICDNNSMLLVWHSEAHQVNLESSRVVPNCNLNMLQKVTPVSARYDL